MNLEVLTIGTELLLGYTLDTNGAQIGRLLGHYGIRVVRRTSVADRAPDIRSAFTDALTRTGAVLATGGLGPTRDDVTKRVVSELFGAPLEFDEGIWQSLVDRFERMGRKISPTNRCQAEVPRGAIVLPNRWGTAPGLWLERPIGLAVLLPGVPREMRNLLEHEVVPRLSGRGAGRVIRSRTIRTTGIPESRLAEEVGELESGLEPLTLAFLPGFEGVDMRLTAWDLPPDEADRRLADATALIRTRAAPWVYGEGEADLAAVVLDQLRTRGQRLAVGESCTGGMLGERITAVPGSSEVFVGGVIAYDNRVKAAELAVPPATIAEHGAVSEPVARRMAEGVAERFGVDAALSVTGVAGPSGGTAEKPVGTVCFGVRYGGRTATHRAMLPGDRQEIRQRAAQAALHLLHRMLDTGSA
jgi:nicotinamide-nucleotide amidase